MSLKNILPPKRKKNYHFLFLLGFIFLTQAISAQAVTDIKDTKTCNEYGGTCENSLICSSGKIDKGDCDGWSITNPNNCCVYGTAITPMSEEECNSAPVLGICQLSPCANNEILVGGCGLASNCCRKKNSAIIAPSSTSSFDYTPLEPIPGATNDTSTLAGFLEGLYFFVMWSAGVMAMFMIGLGGFWYLTSAGNTSRVGEAKTIIVNALLGLLVLTFTWLILYIINPDLTKLDWSSLENLNVGSSRSSSQQGGGGTGGGPGGPGNGKCEEVATGYCSIAELKKSCFQRFEGQNPNIYTQASQVCNVESHGNIDNVSGSDKCKDGTSFSYGLFQINFTYHCPGGMAGGKNYSCTGKGPNYNSCMQNFTGASGWANNIQKACDLYAGRGWGDWLNTRKKCGF